MKTSQRLGHVCYRQPLDRRPIERDSFNTEMQKPLQCRRSHQRIGDGFAAVESEPYQLMNRGQFKERGELNADIEQRDATNPAAREDVATLEKEVRGINDDVFDAVMDEHLSYWCPFEGMHGRRMRKSGIKR
jgi:hypothetical protein